MSYFGFSRAAPEVHGTSRHTDRAFTEIVPAALATLWLGAPVFGLRTETPTWQFRNGFQDGVVAVVRIPKGAVSLDSIEFEFIEPAGAVAAGDAVLVVGGESDSFTAGDIVPAVPEPVASSVAVPAEGADDVLRRFAPLVTIAADAADDFVRIAIYRDAVFAGDTFEDDLYLVGFWLTWTVDQ